MMIVVSDNTATNMVIERITADAVNAEMDRYGLTATRSMRKVLGDGKALKDPSGFSAAGKLPENKRFGLGSTTPKDMVTLLQKLERGEVVNPAASKEMIAILKRQQLKEGIGRHLEDEWVASKSGSLDALRSDVGLIFAPKGRVAMAITVDDMQCGEHPHHQQPGEDAARRSRRNGLNPNLRVRRTRRGSYAVHSMQTARPRFQNGITLLGVSGGRRNLIEISEDDPCRLTASW